MTKEPKSSPDEMFIISSLSGTCASCSFANHARQQTAPGGIPLLVSMMSFLRILFLTTLLGNCFLAPAFSQQEGLGRVPPLESEVSHLDHDVKKAGDAGFVFFLFGAFCALWAQNSGRSAWLWFFLGLFFSVFTVLFLLTKNSNDNFEKRRFGRSSGPQ